MDIWTINILLIEGLPLLGFVYYLEHKKRMYLLEKHGLKVESTSSIKEKKLVRGLFLAMAGSALIYTPSAASILGIDAKLSFEMLLIGVIIICAGLSILLSYSIFRPKEFSSNDAFEIK